MKNIPISRPKIAKNAQKYLLEVLNSGWVSSKGPMVERFEKEFARFTGSKYAIATSSGTAAIHLSLAALRIGPGDEVIIPTLTMIAASLPIIYTGATPILVDSEPDTGNIDPAKIEAKITKKTRAIIVVHLNGHPADMDPILSIVRRHKLVVIEDAAESHGAEYKLKKVGSIGILGCFSFYGNKIITTGEGGMVVTNNQKLADRIRSLRNLARTGGKHFYHQEIAFTYRMSSLQAALGLAQLEQADKIIKLKEQLAAIYRSKLKNIPGINLPTQKPYAKRIHWNFDILLSSSRLVLSAPGVSVVEPVEGRRGSINNHLKKHGVETRNFVIPLHLQPAFKKLGLFKGGKYPVAEKLSQQGLSLPLGPDIKQKDILFICKLIEQVMR